MPILTVLQEPDPRLRKIAKPVETIDENILKIMDDMLETMYADNGMGLAATQVNIHKRLVVMDLAWDRDENENITIGNPLKLINPEIIWKSETETPLMEGCLSVPEQRVEVYRPDRVKYTYLNEKGERIETEADGIMAKCIQHEIDHLNGILAIDYLSPLKKQRILKKLEKIKKNRAL